MERVGKQERIENLLKLLVSLESVEDCSGVKPPSGKNGT